MKTNECGDPLPSVYFDALYDPALHDGEVEGPTAVWCSGDGSVEHTEDDLSGAHWPPDLGPPSFYSVYLHCRAGGVECVGDLETVRQARDLITLFKASITYRKGFE